MPKFNFLDSQQNFKQWCQQNSVEPEEDDTGIPDDITSAYVFFQEEKTNEFVFLLHRAQELAGE